MPTLERSDWLAVWLLFGCGLTAAMQLGVVPPVMPVLISDLGFSTSQAGWAVSLVNLLGVPLSLVAGVLGMRLGLRRTLGLGLLVMALGSGLSALAQSPWQFLAARALTGLGYLAVVVVAPTLMVLACRANQRALATGLWGTFVPVGIALGAGLAGQVGDWRWSMVLVGLPAILGAALVRLRVSATTPPLASAAQPALPGSGRRALVFAAGFGCYSASVLACLALLPLFLDRTAGWTASQTGAATGLVAFASVPGALLAGWLMARGVSFAMVALLPLLVSGLCGLGVFAWANGPQQAVLLACLGQVFAGLMSGAAFSMVPLVAGSPGRLARVNALIAQFGNLGSLVGPPIAGFVMGGVGFGWPGVGVSILAFVIVSIGLLILGVQGSRDEMSRGTAPPVA